MKKKILFCAALALCLGAGITTAVHVTQAANRASNLTLENIEAMAILERWTITTWSCDGNKHPAICRASCGECDSEASGTGNLSGSHSCGWKDYN